jgi:putative endonuclease
MPHRRALLGAQGERLAAHEMESRGYRIIEKNVRTKSGEIDIVALDDAVLVIAEVRTRRGQSYGTAAESITAAKREKLRRVAAEYVQAHPQLPSDYRIDVVLVEMDAAGGFANIELLPAAVGEE